MTEYNCIQRSTEWYTLRRGKFTASEFDILMPTPSQKKEWNDSQLNIIYRIAAERMTEGSIEEENYQSKDMARGTEYEKEARTAYEIETGNTVRQIGFLEYSEWIGCSPDGLIDPDGGQEIKCPKSKTHLKYRIDNRSLEFDYRYQVQGNLWISGRNWWDLISYDPRFLDEEKQILIIRVFPNKEEIEKLKLRIDSAIVLAKEIIAK